MFELLSQNPVLTRQQSGNTADFNFRRGLNSFELHPDFANQGSFGYGKAYAVVSQSASGNGELGTSGNNHDSVLVEYDLSSTNFIENTNGLNGTAASPAREVLRLAQTGPSHNGFDLAFRPDGQLFVSVGDGTANSFNDDNGARLQLAQNLDSAFRSVLRINPDAGAAQSIVSANGQYSIPADNPFIGQTSSVTGNAALPEIYANGFRSPFRIAVDPNNPGQVILGDVGNGAREEINVVVAGGNYGWGIREGSIGVNTSEAPTEKDKNDANLGEAVLKFLKCYSINLMVGSSRWSRNLRNFCLINWPLASINKEFDGDGLSSDEFQICKARC